MQQKVQAKESVQDQPVSQKDIPASQLEKSIMKSLANRQQQKSQQNPKIGRPAKTNQQQQFKKCYLQNKQKFQLQCQLLVFIHQSYFDQIIDNPINARIPKNYLDRMFITFKQEDLYRVLLVQNEKYFKNSSLYPDDKLMYTSLIDVAYLCRCVKQKIGKHVSSTQLLLIVFFHLYNQKLINYRVHEYFVQKWEMLRQGMIFGPRGQTSKHDNFKLQKLEKLIICLALTLAQRQKLMIQQEVDKYQVVDNSGSQEEDESNSYKRNKSQVQENQPESERLSKKRRHPSEN